MSGYPFVRTEHGWLVAHMSAAEPGQRHIKVMLADTTPESQRTLNLYVSGRFEVSVRAPGGLVFSQVMEAGQSSLDLTLPLPAGAIVTERALEPGSVRCCFDAVDPAQRWLRRRVDVAAGEALAASDDEVLMDLSAQVLQQAVGPAAVFVFSKAKATA